MVERRIQDFATAEDALGDDLLLVFSEGETYNMRVKTLKEAVQGDADRAEAAAEKATELAAEAVSSAREARTLFDAVTLKAQDAAQDAAASASAAAESQAAAKASKEAAAKSESASADSADKAKAEADRAAQITTNTFIYAYDLTLTTDGWTECSDEAATAAGLAYQYDAALADCTDRLEPSATVAMVSIPAAQKAGLGAVCESRAGAVRFWAAKLPEAEISLRLLLTNRTGEEAS